VFSVVRVTMGYGIETNLNRKQSENGGNSQKKSICVFVVYPMSIVERTVDGLARVMLMDVSSLITDYFMTLPKTGNHVLYFRTRGRILHGRGREFDKSYYDIETVQIATRANLFENSSSLGKS
jgi:hypothetical protein